MGESSESGKFPPVVLDNTLYDMLRESDNDAEIETYCCIKPNSNKAMGYMVPHCDKYIIHSAQIDSGDDLFHLQIEICSHLLMFFAGKMNTMFLGAEGISDDPTLSKESVHKMGEDAFAVIQESQRPIVHTYKNIEDAITNHDGSPIRWAFGVDFAERLPYNLHPEITYELNSKRWLAVEETLKSANDLVIDCDIRCSQHRINNEWYFGGETCQQCVTGVNLEVRRVHNILQSRPPPFVLKMTQSLSAVGTNIATDEDSKKQILADIDQYLKDFLPRITKENAHLKTTALILSDCLDGETMALNFFVRRDGSVLYLGACQQLSTGESGKQCTAMTYPDQEQLQPRYQNALDKIGLALNKMGYYGPVGADIMADKDGRHNTIDLNVRTPLSLLLYLLKGHFYDKRGFRISMVYECVMLGLSRADFEDEFRKELEEGRIVIIAHTRMGDKNAWGFGLVLAGEEKSDVDKLSDRILEHEVQAGRNTE